MREMSLDDQVLAAAHEVGDRNKSFVLLIMYAVRSDAHWLAKSLAELSQLPEPDLPHDDMGEFDEHLFSRVRSVLPKDEAWAWGAAFVQCLRAGDLPRKEALTRLLQRRLAS